ncbi:MAG: NAD-dependent epimerase/dehydratase family protein [Parachlamydiales bacterium]|nr:NAD-dependent epimerase/dehydratase family protein [Parachlamydiales bacterium]
MAILVTGAAGFIGTNLSRALLEQGKKVIGVDNLITGTKQNIAFLQRFKSFSFLEMDIADPLLGPKLTATPIDEIYELACPTGVDNLTKIPLQMLSASTIGVINLCEIAVKKKAALLFASSSEVYGDPKITPQTEDYTGNVAPLGSRSAYEEGKRCAESIIAAYCRTRSLKAVIARVFNVYGPFFSDRDTRVIFRFLRLMKQGKKPEIFGDGRQTRSFIYIDDLIEGFALLMKKGQSGEAYNIGSDTSISINDLTQITIRAASSTLEPIHLPKHPLDLQNTRLPDLNKIKSLGWKNRISLEVGLRETVRWMSESK